MPLPPAPLHLLRRLAAFALAVALLGAGLTLGPAPEPAAAACAARSTRLGGTIQGEDGRYMWVMLGLEYFDAAGRRLDANGCPMPTGEYSDLYRINRNMMSGHGGQPAPPNPGDAVDCTSFSQWRGAKAWHDIYAPRWGDVARLRSGGTVCPSLPGAPLR